MSSAKDVEVSSGDIGAPMHMNITDESRLKRRQKKLIIQIPCLNEAETLPATLADLPRQVPGYDLVEWLVIDDGSTDGTAEVAEALGVDHIVRLGTNRGLAAAFMKGLEVSLRLGADTIVNTDADNQYRGECIPDLVQPIVERRAQMVVGARPILERNDFSWLKRRLQRIGSYVVRVASGTDIPDAPSGFRAIHRDAAMQLNVFNSYTYTLETIIQAGRKGIPVTWVSVNTNASVRPSRLVRSIPHYIFLSAATILRIFITYKPARFFGILGVLALIPGLIAIGRFLFLFVMGSAGGHIQSLTLGGTLVAIAALLMMVGVLADLIATNRRLLEEIRVKLWRAELLDMDGQ